MLLPNESTPGCCRTVRVPKVPNLYSLLETSTKLSSRQACWYCGWTKSCTTLKWEAIVCWYFTGNRIIPGFLRWCEMDFVHPQQLARPKATHGAQAVQESLPSAWREALAEASVVRAPGAMLHLLLTNRLGHPSCGNACAVLLWGLFFLAGSTNPYGKLATCGRPCYLNSIPKRFVFIRLHWPSQCFSWFGWCLQALCLEAFKPNMFAGRQLAATAVSCLQNACAKPAQIPQGLANLICWRLLLHASIQGQASRAQADSHRRSERNEYEAYARFHSSSSQFISRTSRTKHRRQAVIAEGPAVMLTSTWMGFSRNSLAVVAFRGLLKKDLLEDV